MRRLSRPIARPALLNLLLATSGAWTPVTFDCRMAMAAASSCGPQELIRHLKRQLCGCNRFEAVLPPPLHAARQTFSAGNLRHKVHRWRGQQTRNRFGAELERTVWLQLRQVVGVFLDSPRRVFGNLDIRDEQPSHCDFAPTFDIMDRTTFSTVRGIRINAGIMVHGIHGEWPDQSLLADNTLVNCAQAVGQNRARNTAERATRVCSHTSASWVLRGRQHGRHQPSSGAGRPAD